MSADPLTRLLGRAAYPAFDSLAPQIPATPRPGLHKGLILLALILACASIAWIWIESRPPSVPTAADPATAPTIILAHEAAENAVAINTPHQDADVPRPSISGEAPEDNRAQLSGEQQRLDRLYQALEHGRRQAAMGRYHQAAMHFTEAVRLDPDNADARYRLALACVRCGRVPAARRHMQALEQLDPNRASLLRNLVRSRVPLAAVPLPTDGRSRHAPCHR